MLFNKILVPTDFSPSAELALDRALSLRESFGAAITLFHSHDLPIVYAEFYGVGGETVRSLTEDAEVRMKTLEARVRARSTSQDRSLPPVTTKVVGGKAAEAIVEEAKRGGYDLIVIATHGHRGLAHYLLGSVAERVVRTAPCEVLVVRRLPTA